MAYFSVLLSVLLFPFILRPVVSSTLQSVPELEAAMYKSVSGTACVRLLTLSGEIGCGNPGREKVTAPIVRLENADDDLEKTASVLIPFNQLSSLLNRTLNEPTFTKHVAGVLVEFPGSIEGTSDDKKFPEAPFAPYNNKSYVWNPLGSEIIEQHFNFPVYLLSKDDTTILQEFALENQKRNFNYPSSVAEFDIIMQTTKVGATTSDACLAGGSCLPLGGYSVWSSLPPLTESASLAKPIILAVTSMDSASFFRDKTVGADSPLSGMISLLAAVDALSRVTDQETWTKQLVIAVFTGESWGYLGSRRFLAELSSGGESINGLNKSNIYQILEVGSVGSSLENVFYAHTEHDEPSAATQELLDSLQVAASSFTDDNVSRAQVELASKSNPGVPPSSFMTFLHENLSGVVLTEFDSAFVNKFYHNTLDTGDQVNVSSIVSAASLVARTLYLLVTGKTNLTSSESDLLAVNTTLTEQLVGCLTSCSPGMTCSLVNSLITPTQNCPNHYVGVFLGDPSTAPVLQNIDDTARFVWNFLANRTASSTNGSECSTDCNSQGEVCVGSTVEHKGVCVKSTTRYVPAYSTRVHLGSSFWEVIPASPGDKMGEVDPVFTESYWKQLGVRVYTRESSVYDAIVLAVGLIVTVGSFFTIISAKTVLRKRLKHA